MRRIALVMMLLAGCASVRPGVGVVEGVTRSPGDSAFRVAETGGTYPMGYLIRVRMEDGSLQSVMQNARDGLNAGDRVRITPDGRVSRLTSP